LRTALYGLPATPCDAGATPLGRVITARDRTADARRTICYHPASSTEHARVGRTQQIASFSIVLGTAVLTLKGGAWWLTGSAALFSDALESTVNVAAALMALVAVRLAETPADANHPYGHEKAEFFAAVVEGALIVIASFSILVHAWESWWHPLLVATPWAGLALTGLATALNAGWAVVLLRAGRSSRSPALDGEGRHLWTDVVTSLVVIAGVSLAVWTGQTLIDTGLAVAVAVHVLWSGLRLVSQSVGGLMDAAPAPEVVERIRRLVREHAHGALEAHDLRTRHAGRLTYLEFHLVVPGDLSVSEAHAICDRIEAALREDMEHLVITIHVEPEAKAKHQGVLVL
jgi:cation diffusion facilitator family transporter